MAEKLCTDKECNFKGLLALGMCSCRPSREGKHPVKRLINVSVFLSDGGKYNNGEGEERASRTGGRGKMTGPSHHSSVPLRYHETTRVVNIRRFSKRKHST